MSIKISVIVPVYNVEEYLEECLNSLIDQSYKDLEIILVDDGSTDRSSEICDRYAEKDKRIIVTHKDNGGLSDARNEGIIISTGDYISFVDSDDWLSLDAYERICVAINEVEADIICFGFYDFFSDGIRKGMCPQNKCTVTGQEAFLRLLKNDGIGGYACFKIYRKSLFDQIRFPKGELFEDIAIMPDLLLSAETVTLLNERLYYYRHRRGSILNSGFSPKKLIHLNRAERLMQLGKEQGPVYEEAAKHYYANTLLTLLSLFDTSPFGVRTSYHEKYDYIKKEIKSYSRYLDKRNKIKYFLLKIRILRFIKALYSLKKIKI